MTLKIGQEKVFRLKHRVELNGWKIYKRDTDILKGFNIYIWIPKRKEERKMDRRNFKEKKNMNFSKLLEDIIVV